jgi:voltage-gated potassium channel Kch
VADFVLQATISNLVVASILAVIAWVVQRQVRSASLSNLLWAVVLIKLITPPLVSIPVLEVPSISSSSVLETEPSSGLAPPMELGIVDLTRSTDSERALILAADATSKSVFAAIGMRHAKAFLVVWLAISGILFVISAFRIVRFHWLLKENSSSHGNLSHGLSVEVARQLGLNVHPNILVTRANVAPFVWWIEVDPDRWTECGVA